MQLRDIVNVFIIVLIKGQKKCPNASLGITIQNKCAINHFLSNDSVILIRSFGLCSSLSSYKKTFIAIVTRATNNVKRFIFFIIK